MKTVLAAKCPTKNTGSFPACISYNPNENAHNSTFSPQALQDDPHCADAPHSRYILYPQVCQSVATEGEVAPSRPDFVTKGPGPQPPSLCGYAENAITGSVGGGGICPSKMKAPPREPFRQQYCVTCQRTGINALLW
jgi:hypothetical protein